MPTLFEKIMGGELPATIVYRDPRVIAFLDIRPAAPVHILVVPTKVIPTTDDIADEDEALIGHMVIVARDIARQQGIAKSGYRLIINCNPDSGQEVYHLHVHLLGAGRWDRWYSGLEGAAARDPDDLFETRVEDS